MLCVKVIMSLTVRCKYQAEMQVGFSEPIKMHEIKFD